ncbi:Uncharacterized protein BP5553_06481 [Venustampulla echinocandica]|uniref:Ubiquitin carrier protein n=1 Tax=Venustampulla echinocandica TaxID=2656787 RepID=A0A370TK23_9HELO|nr:Uncharacterized protein BP5553_06481 [Venustampulla echinocandica]RDL35869.1 Uncharacterized protein BP5553_06481 [Venustampulla echinocandica]
MSSSTALVGSLMRRGMDAAASKKGSPDAYQMPLWGILLIGTTVVLFVAASTMIEYTFGRLIPALLMIESPPEAIRFEPLATEDDDSSPKKTTPEIEGVKPTPITASFRSSIRLLKSKGGFRARFRGISIFIVNVVVMQWLAQFLSILPFVGFFIAPVIAAVICTPLSLAWTHIVISEPSPKTWLRRLPPMKTWRKVALPTALAAVAEQVSVLIPLYLILGSNLHQSPEQIARMTPHEVSMLSLKLLGFSALSLVFFVVLVIPANVTLTRVQASLLSDAEETIVPFDRSFNGKVVPEIVGGTGVVGIFDAWTTFDWSARLRLFKAYAKVFVMEFALSLLFFTTLAVQLATIISKEDWKKIKKGAKNGGVQFM